MSDTYTKEDEEMHDRMLEKLKPLIDYATDNGFGFWVTIGRKGQAANYCGGGMDDVIGAVTDLVERNPQVAYILKSSIEDSLL
jgi:hypothetical protein